MKKMLTHHTPRKKNERNSQRRTKNTKLEIFSPRHFAKKKWVCEILQSSVDPPKAKKEERKLRSFLSFPHFSSSIALFSFFLSFSAATKPEFFLLFARAKTERERLREAFEKAFFDSFYLYTSV